MRYQFRRSDTLRGTEIPLEGEPIWDDQGRRLGFYNSADNTINWFRIPRTGESENYIPEHRWVGSELQFKLPNGNWNPGEDLRGEGVNNIAFVDNGDGTVKFIFYTATTSYELDIQLTPRHLGVFQIDVQYVPLDEVSYEGSTYRVKYGDNPPIGTLPTNTTYFVLIARRGDSTGDPTWSAIQDKPIVFPPDTHTHAIANITDLQEQLDNKALTTTSIFSGTGILGGGDLTTDRTLSIDKASTAQIRTGTADKVITADGAVAAKEWVPILPADATPAIIHTDGINRTITYTTDTTFGAPSAAMPGFQLVIDIIPGIYTTTWNAVYKFGTGGAPVITTRALVTFICRDPSTFIFLSITEL